MTWEDVGQFAERYRLRECACVAFVLFSGTLFAATHWPDPPKVDIGSYRPSDKMQHFAGYFVFTILLTAALRLSKWSLWRTVGRLKLQAVCLLAVVLVCGSLDELTQPAFGRECSAYDLAADMLGAVFATMLCALLDVSLNIARRFRWSRYESLESLLRN